MAVFYDTHAHLDYPDFQEDLPQILERATQAGISRVITIGTDLESSQRAVALAEQFEQVFAAVGWHPSYVENAPIDLREPLRALANHPKVVAIGETGLDYYRLPSKSQGATPDADEAYKHKQRLLFRQQLEVAAELGLNCIIHQRESFSDTLHEMRPFAGRVRGVFHCFVGDPASMEQVLELGSLVSFTGIVTFKNAEVIRQTVAAVPLNRFMLETDCPFLAPVPFRGKRCEPAYVQHVSEMVAQVRGCSLEELSDATCATAHEFFPKLA